jgi:hypothetical protein
MLATVLSRTVCLLVCSQKLKNYILYGCETWSLTLREEHRLRVFEKRLLRRILGPKRDEVTGEWRKLNYTPTTLAGGGGTNLKRLHLGVREQKRVEYHCCRFLQLLLLVILYV